jgi:peptide deformylase
MPAIREIRSEKDELLRKVAKPVATVTPAIEALVDDMLYTLKARDGVGLAAPQVGALRRVIVIDFEDEIYEMINPEIISADGEQTCNEACLSVPLLCGDVIRPMNVVVQASNRHGDVYTVEADEFLTSILCHELDHLDGILFTDKATNIKQLTQEQYDRRKLNRRQRRRRMKGR